MADRNTATLSGKFQISIPMALCNAKGWTAGQRLVLLPKGNALLLMAIPDRDSLLGIAQGAQTEDYRDRGERS